VHLNGQAIRSCVTPVSSIGDGKVVTLSGLGTLTWQWRFNQSGLLGKTNSSLSLTNVQSANAGGYDVVV
jgi:aerobic-type carbon monoxide dehydrogenase small subunit (CoxS/CutS family)